MSWSSWRPKQLHAKISQVVLFGINWVLLYDIHTFFHKMYDTGYVVVVCSVFEEDFEFGSWEEAREVV